MKKFLALALVIAMVISIVPAAFAAPATEDADLANAKIDHPFAQTSIDENGNFVESRVRDQKVVTNSTLSKKYRNADLTKAQLADLDMLRIPVLEGEEANENGYWLDTSEGHFQKVNDIYTDGHEAWAQFFMPAAVVTDGTLPYEYNKGQIVWFNYDLALSHSGDQIVDLPELGENDEPYTMEIAAYGLNISDPEGTSEYIGEWSSTETGMSIKLTAPEDGYVFYFLVIVDEADRLDSFCALTNVAVADKNFKEMPHTDKMTVGTAVKTDIGSQATKTVLSNLGEYYMLENAKAYEIQLEGGKFYGARIGGEMIGLNLFFCDSDMNIINEAYIAAGAYDQGATQDDFVLRMFPTTSGTYYLVVAGLMLGDEGVVETTVLEWKDIEGAVPPTEVNETINLANLAEDFEVHTDPNNEEIVYWGFTRSSESNRGLLLINYPGTYTIKGNDPTVSVLTADAVKVVYDNATTGSFSVENMMAPVTIESKGTSTIDAAQGIFFTAVSNYRSYATAGLYIEGETLNVKGEFGFLMENAALHLGAKTLDVDTTGRENYLPIAVWVIGLNDPTIVLGKNAKFDGNNKVCEMLYDEQGHFHEGYTVAESTELIRRNDGYMEAAYSFKLTTDGFGQGGSQTDAFLGDANLDGKVNTGDATMILRHAAEIITLEGQGLVNADVNKDGKVNTGDATMVLRIVAEIIPQP